MFLLKGILEEDGIKETAINQCTLDELSQTDESTDSNIIDFFRAMVIEIIMG